MREKLTDAAFGYPAWRGFIAWAIKQPEMREQFTAETGHQWPSAAKNGLEAMIDGATGYHEKVAEAFMLWATKTHWGADEAPPEVRAALNEARDD